MKIPTALLYWRDNTGGVLLRRDGMADDYMCTSVMLAAQVLQGGRAIVVTEADADATVGELLARGVEVSEVQAVPA